MNSLLYIVAILTITVYVPGARGMNGCIITADGSIVETGYAACGNRYEFGTTFVLPEEVEEHGLPRVVICKDRGSMVYNSVVDIALVSGDVRGDLKKAYSWGRRRREVEIYKSFALYEYTMMKFKQVQYVGE